MYVVGWARGLQVGRNVLRSKLCRTEDLQRSEARHARTATAGITCPPPRSAALRLRVCVFCVLRRTLLPRASCYSVHGPASLMVFVCLCSVLTYACFPFLSFFGLPLPRVIVPSISFVFGAGWLPVCSLVTVLVLVLFRCVNLPWISYPQFFDLPIQLKGGL